MKASKLKLEWSIVYLDSDRNWWVAELSEKQHWDMEEPLGIIDPHQMSYLLDLIEGLREYGFQSGYLEDAFFRFSIDRELANPKGHIRLIRYHQSYRDSDEPLFWLPNNIDEEKGPYAEFVDHITRLQLKMLNDLHKFQQMLTVDDLEEEIRERQNAELVEGRSPHFFHDLRAILEYVPQGYEAYFEDEDGSTRPAKETAAEELIPDDPDDVAEDDSSPSKQAEFMKDYKGTGWQDEGKGADTSS